MYGVPGAVPGSRTFHDLVQPPVQSRTFHDLVQPPVPCGDNGAAQWSLGIHSRLGNKMVDTPAITAAHVCLQLLGRRSLKKGDVTRQGDLFYWWIGAWEREADNTGGWMVVSGRRWLSALVCEPRVPGSNSRYTLTTSFFDITAEWPKTTQIAAQIAATTFICVWGCSSD